jgi:hypothetical protein
MLGRLQEECQSRDDAGYDEGRYDSYDLSVGRRDTNLHKLGQVEKTNDRDYEVEERFATTHSRWILKRGPWRIPWWNP